MELTDTAWQQVRDARAAGVERDRSLMSFRALAIKNANRHCQALSRVAEIIFDSTRIVDVTLFIEH
jgi:hypothetical protein